MRDWQLNSWSTKPNVQDIQYPNGEDLITCVDTLSQKPNIVDFDDIQKLQFLLAEAGKGNIIVLQGGDCAEQFSSPLNNSINSVNLLNELSNFIKSKTKIPVIIIGRIAGQFAKPRTSMYDLENKKVLSYRGDLINKYRADVVCRQPDPNLLIKGYYKSQDIYKLLKNLPSKEIENIKHKIPHIFTSHEALNLHYEQALTHKGLNGKYYNFSTHCPWVGVRTNQIDSAHVEYLRGINNPIGIKIDSKMNVEKMLEILNYLNPENIPGRISLITRFGYNNASKYLPKLIQATSENDKKVTWLCDPMHGNTIQDNNGIKSRVLNDIRKEILTTTKIHNSYNSVLAGLHLELTPEKIKECRTTPNEETDCPLVDPRLNKEQSIEVVQLFCESIIKEKNRE